MKINETKTFKKLKSSPKNNDLKFLVYSKGNELSVIIDTDKYGDVSKYKWYVKHNNYIYTQINRKTIHLHRLIMGAKTGEFVDHINRNPLDNRIKNLRFCTRSENNMNKNGVRGVSRFRDGWRARIKKDGKEIHLGIFKSFNEALEKRKSVEIIMFGNFANV